MEQELFFDLYAVPRMTETRLKRLLEVFVTPAAIFGARLEELTGVPGVDEELGREIVNYRRGKAVDERIQAAIKMGVRAVSYRDQDYPENLKGVAHMPPVLFIRGEIIVNDRLAVAIVGTRFPSHYGREVAERLAREIAGAGTTVVSGLARGVDTLAHRGALAAKGRTIAVLGCGIDVCYPPENRQLMEAIVKQGAVVSEYPLGMEPLAMNFPKRNRIISALSKAVVAVEAGDKSGVLNTCAWAKEQGRDVYAVPGRLGDEKSIGTNRLLRNGAKVVTGSRDILERLGVLFTVASEPVVPVDETEKPVLAVLSNEPVHIDEVCEAAGVPMAQLLNIMFQLEVKGLVRQLPGKFFVRVG